MTPPDGSCPRRRPSAPSPRSRPTPRPPSSATRRRGTRASTPASSRTRAAPQVEYPLPVLDRKLLLSFEAFDFSRPNDLAPHLRLLGRYQFHPNLYLVGGYDDPLERNRSFFLGGGIRWNDDNIKSLLGLAGGLR